METAMSVVPMIRPFATSRANHLALPSFEGVIAFALRISGMVARELRIRRDMRRLAEFDEHMLHDVGITRSDIEGAVRRGHDGSCGA
jgi:uncharacterized protein YjiS (DUF1127 family)